MASTKRTPTKRSLGNLRTAPKSKPHSPSSIGDIRIQRHTLLILMKQLNEQNGDEIICNLAGWRNLGKKGPFLTIELSPRFVRKIVRRMPSEPIRKEVQ